MFHNVRQKILPYNSIFVAAKSFTWKTFLKIRCITYESIGLTTNNRENPRQPTKNYDFRIRTLSHLKGRMWETSIMLVYHIRRIRCNKVQIQKLQFFVVINIGFLTLTIVNSNASSPIQSSTTRTLTNQLLKLEWS